MCAKSAPWAEHGTEAFWAGCQFLPCLVPTRECTAAVYGNQVAYYLAALVTHLTIDVRRGDHEVLLLHHVVTLVLLAYSFYLGVTEIGLATMLLHDVCDVLMESAKLFRYAGWRPQQ